MTTRLRKLKSYLKTRMKGEPVLTYGFLIALINLAVVFGVPLTAEQLGALDTALIAFLSFHVRKKVTPVEGN